jgi:hypothetical protein
MVSGVVTLVTTDGFSIPPLYAGWLSRYHAYRYNSLANWLINRSRPCVVLLDGTRYASAVIVLSYNNAINIEVKWRLYTVLRVLA